MDKLLLNIIFLNKTEYSRTPFPIPQLTPYMIHSLVISFRQFSTHTTSMNTQPVSQTYFVYFWCKFSADRTVAPHRRHNLPHRPGRSQRGHPERLQEHRARAHPHHRRRQRHLPRVVLGLLRRHQREHLLADQRKLIQIRLETF